MLIDITLTSLRTPAEVLFDWRSILLACCLLGCALVEQVKSRENRKRATNVPPSIDLDDDDDDRSEPLALISRMWLAQLPCPFPARRRPRARPLPRPVRLALLPPLLPLLPLRRLLPLALRLPRLRPLQRLLLLLLPALRPPCHLAFA